MCKVTKACVFFMFERAIVGSSGTHTAALLTLGGVLWSESTGRRLTLITPGRTERLPLNKEINSVCRRCSWPESPLSEGAALS